MMDKIGALKRSVIVVVFAGLIGSIPPSAQAGDLIDTILGVFGTPPPAASPVQIVPSEVVSAPLRITITPSWSSAFRGVSGYCVRLCDGRYFPLPRFASSTTPVKICAALCPYSRTMVYWGAPIDQARTSNGSRYSDLTTAFGYRKEVVQNCTCNGTDIFGTAAIPSHGKRTGMRVGASCGIRCRRSSPQGSARCSPTTAPCSPHCSQVSRRTSPSPSHAGQSPRS